MFLNSKHVYVNYVFVNLVIIKLGTLYLTSLIRIKIRIVLHRYSNEIRNGLERGPACYYKPMSLID